MSSRQETPSEWQGEARRIKLHGPEAFAAMRKAGAGTLLFTTGGGSVSPVPAFGNVNAAAAALRNWVINLHNELAGTGVHAAHVAINIWIGDGGPPGFPTATPEQIAPLYWDLYERNHRSEVVFNG